MCQESGVAQLGASGSGFVTKAQSGFQPGLLSSQGWLLILKASALSCRMVAEREPLDRAVYNIATGFLQSEQVRQQEREARQKPESPIT